MQEERAALEELKCFIPTNISIKFGVYKLHVALEYILHLMLFSKKKKKPRKINTFLYESWIAPDCFNHCSEQYAKHWSKHRAAGKIKITGNIRSLQRQCPQSRARKQNKCSTQGVLRPETCKVTGMPWSKLPLEQKYKWTWKPASTLHLSEGCVQHHPHVSFPFSSWKTGEVNHDV